MPRIHAKELVLAPRYARDPDAEVELLRGLLRRRKLREEGPGRCTAEAPSSNGTSEKPGVVVRQDDTN